MDVTSLVGPAVVAALISSIVSGIGVWISSRTTRTIHSEKLAFDREQAERRTSAEIALAERKVSLDRAFEGWRRRAEFAEEVLADFYEARDVINSVRSPATFEGEGGTRKKYDWETDADTNTLNMYFATIERLQKRADLFSQLYSRRYRFIAYFGQKSSKPYDDIHKIYVDILISATMLLQTHQERTLGTLPQSREGWQKVIWDHGDGDSIRLRLEHVMEAIEVICGPAIRDIANFGELLHA